MYAYKYKTPKEFSDLWMLSDGEVLTGLVFEDEKPLFGEPVQTIRIPIFDSVSVWLDGYFKGILLPLPQVRIMGTPFQKKVYDILMRIPYGEVRTYGDIAKEISPSMSAQAVGQAVGSNPICIIIPCHRVVGRDGKLTGYRGGLENKKQLLLLEQKNICL